MTQHPKYLKTIIYDPTKLYKSDNSQGTNIITGPLCSAKYRRSFGGNLNFTNYS